MIFMFLLKFFSTNNTQFSIYIVPSNSKVLKISRLKEKARQQFSEFNFPRSCSEKKDLYLCRNLSNTTSLTVDYTFRIWILIFNFRQPKMNVDAFIMFLSYISARSFELHTLMYCFP